MKIRLLTVTQLDGREISQSEILTEEDTYTKNHQQVEVRVCLKEEMYSIFCRIHNGDMGEGHGGQNATWIALNAQYCCFPQNICKAACRACSVCCSTTAIRKTPEGKPIISARFLQRVQVMLVNFVIINELNCLRFY